MGVLYCSKMSLYLPGYPRNRFLTFPLKNINIFIEIPWASRFISFYWLKKKGKTMMHTEDEITVIISLPCSVVIAAAYDL
jgi:hypothetical protein